MKKIWVPVLGAVIVLAMAFSAYSINYDEPVISDSVDQVNPSISGDTVIWQDYRNKPYGCDSANNCLPADVFMSDLNGGAEQRLSATSFALDPDISGDLVVWKDWNNGKIIVHDLSDDSQQHASLQPDYIQEVNPKIDGDIVVWADYRDSDEYANIYMRDLNEPTDVPLVVASTDPGIPSTKKIKRNPNISGDIVVWEDWRNAYQDESGWWHNPDIYMKDIYSGDDIAVCTDTGDQYRPIVYGDKIFWQDYRNGNWDIYMKDLTAGTETRITVDDADQCWPSVDGDMLTWRDNRNGNEDIYMMPLSTGVEQPVTVNTAEQKMPVVSGDTFIWIDKRNGNWDIYMNPAPPEVTSVEPSGLLSASSTTITASYQDFGSGIDATSAQVMLDGTVLSGCSADSTGVSCPVSGLSEGTHSIEVSVNDNSGNSSTGSGSFDVDTTAPSINITSPTGWIASGSANISAGFDDGSGSGVDPATVTVKLDDSAVAGCSADSTGVSCPVSGLGEGSHSIFISANDNAGNHANASSSFSVDTTSPVISQITINASPDSDQAAITVDYYDPAPGSGVDTSSVQVAVDGDNLTGCQVSGSQISCTATNLGSGFHNMSVQLVDNVGNFASATDTFELEDTVPPVISGISPAEDSTVVTAAPPISALYEDGMPGSGIDTSSVVVNFDGIPMTGCDIDGTGVSCETWGLKDGQYNIEVFVSDNAGNQSSKSWTFTVDAAGPTISNTQPAEGQIVNNPWPLISANISENGREIDYESIRLYIDDVLYLDGSDLDENKDTVTIQQGETAGLVEHQMLSGSDPALSEESHEARLVVADAEGTLAEQAWNFTITSPKLQLFAEDVYWPNHTAYENHLLMVDYRLNNHGSGMCNDANVANGNASSGVILIGPVPLYLNDIEPGEDESYSFEYLVPVGVNNFVASSYVSCVDDGGNLHWLSGPPPDLPPDGE